MYNYKYYITIIIDKFFHLQYRFVNLEFGKYNIFVENKFQL